MAQSHVPHLPPVPRPDDLRLSEVIPFRSAKIRIWRSKALAVIVIVGVTCVALFGISVKTTADLDTYMLIVASFILLVSFLILYIYSGEHKNALWYAIPAAATVAQLTYLIRPYIHVFRDILPGDTNAMGFGPAFIGMFFGAGLMEETMKGVPTLVALGIALWLSQTGSTGNALTRNLAVQGPLDGLLMGAAAGAAFILIETMTMYVPTTIGKYSDPATGYLMGFVLMLPRIGKGVVGHMAYAGIFGYFIGLAATHPKAAWKLVPFGLLVAAVLHALWNSIDELVPVYGAYLAAALIALTFFACLLKARQLEASRIGGFVDGLSILALSPQADAIAINPGGLVPPAAGGIAGALVAGTTAMERMIGLEARTTPSIPSAIRVSDAPASGLSIGLGAIRYALTSGLPIDISALFGAAGVPPGFAGDIVGQPDGSLDIVNTGPSAWIMAVSGDASLPVETGMRVRAAPGIRIVCGPAVLDIEAF